MMCRSIITRHVSLRFLPVGQSHGLIGQEAMRCARSVVAFDVGGILDWCDDGETGFVVPEQYVTVFSGALEYLLTNVEIAQKMGQKSFEKAKSQFSFESNLNQLESYLVSVNYSHVDGSHHFI